MRRLLSRLAVALRHKGTNTPELHLTTKDLLNYLEIFGTTGKGKISRYLILKPVDLWLPRYTYSEATTRWMSIDVDHSQSCSVEDNTVVRSNYEAEDTFRLPAARISRFSYYPALGTTPSSLLEKIRRHSCSKDYRSSLISDALAWVDGFAIDVPDNYPENWRRMATWELARDVIGFVLAISDAEFYADPPFIRSQWAEGASDLDTMNEWIDSFELAREAMDRYVSGCVVRDLTRVAERVRDEDLSAKSAAQRRAL